MMIYSKQSKLLDTLVKRNRKILTVIDFVARYIFMSTTKLLKCGLCGNQVSSTVKRCTSCGVEFKKETSLAAWIFSSIFALLVFGSIINSNKQIEQNKNIFTQGNTAEFLDSNRKTKDEVLDLCNRHLQSNFSYSTPTNISSDDSKVEFKENRILVLLVYKKDKPFKSLTKQERDSVEGFCKFSPTYKLKMISYKDEVVRFN